MAWLTESEIPQKILLENPGDQKGHWQPKTRLVVGVEGNLQKTRHIGWKALTQNRLTGGNS